MDASRQRRRLSAVLIADIVGYTRLVEQDTDGTVAAWTAARVDFIDPVIDEYAGRIVKHTGDGFLAEFSTVQDAVACAIAMQDGLSASPLDFRMGVNLGDVIDDGEDIHGEGVNIAARIEALAEPGGINVTSGVVDQIHNRIDVAFEDIGSHAVKHVSTPVHVFRIVRNAGVIAKDKEVLEGPPHRGKPSIAVLPFDNMSSDSDQEYVADGMTEDIITGLSRFRSLFVIARNSTFAYKGKSPGIRQVVQDLGVRYVMEGSVRRAGKRIRITAQLIDAETGSHIWAERYDRDIDDIFVVQDEVTESIVSSIAPEIDEVERQHADRKAPGSVDAWGHYQRGLTSYYQSPAKDTLEAAVKRFDLVNELDPDFAPAFALAADARLRLLRFEDSQRDHLLSVAQEKVRIARGLDSRDPVCLIAESKLHSEQGLNDIAILKAEEAIELNPNSAAARYTLGFSLARAGRAKDAIPHMDHAIRLSPRDSFLAGFLVYRSILLFDLERYEEAFECAQRASRTPNSRAGSFAICVASLMKLDRRNEAALALSHLLSFAPASSLNEFRQRWNWAVRGSETTINIFIDALREAGVPE